MNPQSVNPTSIEPQFSGPGPSVNRPLNLALPPSVEPGSEASASSVADVLRRERTYRRYLAVSDAVAALIAVFAAAELTGREPRWPALLIPAFAVLVAKIQGLYDRDEKVIRKATLTEWRSVVQASAITAIGVYLVWPQVTNAPHGEGMRVFLLLVIASVVVGVPGRGLARGFARQRTPNERCLIVGRATQCGVIAERIAALEGVEVVGSILGAELHRPVADLQELVKQFGIHRLVIVPDADSTDEATLELVRGAKWIGLRVSLFPSLLAAVGGCTVFDELDGMTLLGVPRFGLSRSSRALKRTFDIVGSSAALVVTAPLFVVIAVLIRLDSAGPALFRQTRVGRNGQHFEMLKFRTMVVGAEAMKAQLLELNEAGHGLFKMTDDPRVTKFGKHLRHAHLDELPQLLNVLQGQMSLVGPRPLVVEEDRLLAGGDRYRLHLTPGMTGPWQIQGPMRTPLLEMAKLDYLYISNWSLWQDIDILLKTAVRVFLRAGH